MEKFNDELVKTILSKCKGLTLADQTTREHGRFLADKSYAFDTMFFVARYIQYFRFGDLFSRDQREREDEYIRDLFSLEAGKGQIKNYFTEALALLRFVKAVKYDGRNYRITDDEILEILSSSFENAYIFLYLLTYSVFRDEGLWDIYNEFCAAPDRESKQEVYDRYRELYIAKDKRVMDADKQWAKFTPKYPMVVLNYANRQNMVSRTGRVQAEDVTREDISLNTEGTRNMYDFPKKNSYLEDLSDSYITETLRPYLTYIPTDEAVSYPDSISVDIADTKLLMMAEKYNMPVRRRSQTEKYRHGASGKTRTVQGEFRSGLFKKTPARCPVCGFKYKNFLIASHIKPYAKCDDTYDAMNPNNGFLMCPVCDKLFESANLMTIDYNTGEVIYVPEIEDEKDFQYLHGRRIDAEYVDCERKHYLKWHNEFFREKHGRSK